ncbi:MAG TPA: hypothetical protein VJS65_12745 [Verrucomicrobiae bacterium]|nr:hypothetical protein [Verrucomicrobiae bacterium]
MDRFVADGKRRKQNGNWPTLLMLGTVATILCGCASAEKEVQRVAKDWCTTIRGSQVIPVYPLTEDVQPGDIFLVQLPVDRQQEIYKAKGFLPLDNHIARINPVGYDDFYSHSFLTNGDHVSNILPKDWIRPHGAGMYFGTNGSNSHCWLAAPRAAFPSYSFTVRNGAGLNLAVPVQGVPVALGLLASDAASGSVQIQDARTLGVDTISLYDQLRRWAVTNAGFLHHFGASATGKKTNFLRVITRVYASGHMVVTLKDASNRSAGIDAGVPKPVNLLVPELPQGAASSPTTALQNYTNAWSALSEMVKGASAAKDAAGNILPGGSLRLAAASSRSVSLDEVFDPPVILGYLGFDCAIYKGGVLGPPIPTHAVLDPHFNLGGLLSMNPVYGQMFDRAVYGMLANDTTDKGKAIRTRLDGLEAYVPNEFTNYEMEGTNGPLVARKLDSNQLHSPEFAGYLDYHAFRAKLDTSVKALNEALALSEFKFKNLAGQTLDITANIPARRDLEQARAYYTNLQEQSASNSNIQGAFSDAYAYYLEKLLQ